MNGTTLPPFGFRPFAQQLHNQLRALEAYGALHVPLDHPGFPRFFEAEMQNIAASDATGLLPVGWSIYNGAVLSKNPFILPCLPTLRKEPPTGPQWLHEVKFDGYRVQLHKFGDTPAIYSKTGKDLTKRYPSIANALLTLFADDAIIDAELSAINSEGLPDFRSLLYGETESVCVWCFDLLARDGKDRRDLPYRNRTKLLQKMLHRFQHPRILYSVPFEDPEVLLEACSRMKQEGIVSKRADGPYLSGPCRDWIKVKCPQWREQNAWRHEFFKKQS